MTAGLDPRTLYAIQDNLLLTDYEEDGSSTVWRGNQHGQIIDETGKTFKFVVYPTQETPFTQILRKLQSSSHDGP